jgi:hypothetical protein
MQRMIKQVIVSLGIAVTLSILGCSLFIGSGPSSPPPPSPPPQPAPRSEKGPPPWAPAHGYRAKHHYHYYPESYVYFDVGRRVYFYYYGNGWQVSVLLPAQFYIDANIYVTLDMDTDEPYRYHPEVAKRYPPGYHKKRDWDEDEDDDDDDGDRGKHRGKGKGKHD